jgi:alpha-tubulin suppressor-like RCC1 family protein
MHPRVSPKRRGHCARCAATRDMDGESPTAALGILTDELLLTVAERCTAQDLGRLGSVCRRLRDLPLESVAERALLSSEEGWRVRKRTESFRFLLDVLQRRLAPLPTVAAGGRHTVVLHRAAVFAFGADDSSQLGRGESDVPRIEPPAVAAYQPVPERIERLSSKAVLSVASSSECCLALTSPETQNAVGQLWAWGWLGSGAGAVSEPEHLNDAVVSAPLHVPNSKFWDTSGDQLALIAMGAEHQAAISAEGKLFVWGDNTSGRVGPAAPRLSADMLLRTPQPVPGLEQERFVAVACGDKHTAAVTASGKLFVLGDTFTAVEYRRLEPPPPLIPLAMPGGVHLRGVSCGELHVAAWTVTGELYTFGLMTSGQLGVGPQESLQQAFTARLASFTSRPQRVDLAEGERSPSSSPLRRTRFSGRIVSASCGDVFTAALTDKGKLYTWGHGGHGRLGLGPGFSAANCCWEPQQVMTMAAEQRGSVGPVAPYVNGSTDAYVHTFTYVPAESPLPRVAEVSCGWTHSVLKLEDGRVCAWGQGDCGQLGQGSGEGALIDRLVPALVRLPYGE